MLIDYNNFPNEDIVNRFYNVLSSEPVIANRVIDGVNKTVTFVKDEDLGDLILREVSYEKPIICIKLGSRSDGKPSNNSASIALDTLVVVDITVQANTKQSAEQQVSRLHTNIYQVLMSKKYYGNLQIEGWASFTIGTTKVGELYEESYRTFYHINHIV